MRNPTLTAADLIAILSEYPPDTPIFNGKGYDLHRSSVSEMKYDDWANATPDGEYEIPAVGIGVSIGPAY